LKLVGASKAHLITSADETKWRGLTDDSKQNPSEDLNGVPFQKKNYASHVANSMFLDIAKT
jgi:hypothetical protein